MNDAIQSLLQIVGEQLRNNPGISDAQILAEVEAALKRDPGLQTEIAQLSTEQASQGQIPIKQTPIEQTLSGEARGFQTSVSGGTVYVGGGVDTDKLAAAFEKVLNKVAGVAGPVSVPQNLPRSQVRRFVGREERLAALHQQVKNAEQIQITSIVGMGGLGKTELALQYAIVQYTAGSYPGGVCWLRAKDEEIATQIVRFAKLNLGLAVPEGESVDQVRYCYQQWPLGDVLIVIDDVDDFEQVRPYLPPSDPRFKLLVTTRLALGRAVKRFTISVLDEESGLLLLESIAGSARVRAEQTEAALLCRWVGYLPLGLRLLGQHLADDLDLSMWSLVEELEDVGLEAAALRGISDERGVLQTLELSWQALNAFEQELACLLGMFALAPIPWVLVEGCLAQVDERRLKAGRKGLLDRSLLNRAKSGTYQLHQIVQEFFRVKLRQREDGGASAKAAFAGGLVAVAKGIEYGLVLERVNEVRENIVHLEALAECWSASLSDEDLVQPFLKASYFYQAQGLYELALPWAQKCLEQAKDRMGESHRDVSLSLNNLASLYRDQGKYEQAQPLYEQALAIKQQLFGKAHPEVAAGLNNLAGLYRAQGKYEQAQPLFEQALAMNQQLFDEVHPQLFGEVHPHVAISLNSLASIYQDQGKYEQAQPLYEQALAMRQQLFGKAHPYVATSLNNLACLYRDQGKYEQAQPLYEQALAMRQRLFGEAHPYVATTQYNLGVLYQKKGEYRRAKGLYEQALVIAHQTLGPQHPGTKTIQSWLDSLPSGT